MGLFGFKRAGDKKKKSDTPEPQQPATKIDQNQLGEGQFFGSYAQNGSVSRPGTSHSHRGRKLQKSRPGGAAAVTGGLDSSSNLNLPSQPWADGGRSRSGSHSSAGLPTNDSSFVAMFNARATSPSRPSTSHGSKQWVSPLDVHFKTNTHTTASRPGTPSSSRPGTPGPGGAAPTSKKAPPRLSELDLMRLVNQSQRLEQKLAAHDGGAGGDSSRGSSKPSSPMTANFRGQDIGRGPRSPGLKTSLSTPHLGHHKTTSRSSPLSPSAQDAAQAAQAYARAKGISTTTTSADTTDVDTEDNQTQSTDNTEGTRATSPSLGEDDHQNGQSLNRALNGKTANDRGDNGGRRQSWSAQIENADPSWQDNANTPRQARTGAKPYPLQTQPHSGHPRQYDYSNPRSPTSPFPRDGDYSRPGTAHGPRSGGPPRNNGPRDQRDYGRDPRDPRAQRGDPRDPRYQRDPRDQYQGRDPRGRDPRADPRYRDPRDNRDPRDPRYQRDPRDMRDPRDARARDARSKSRPRNARDARDPRQRDPRDYRGDGYYDGYRDQYGRDPRDQGGYQQHRGQPPYGGYPPQGGPPMMPPPSRHGQRPYSPGPGDPRQGPPLKHQKSRDRMRPPQGQRPPMPRGPPGEIRPQSPRGPPPGDYGYGPQSSRDAAFAHDPYYYGGGGYSPMDESPTFPPEQQLSDAGYRPFSPSTERRHPSNPRHNQQNTPPPSSPITPTQNRARDNGPSGLKQGHPLQNSSSPARAESPPPLAPGQLDYAAMSTPPLSSPSADKDARFRHIPGANLPLSPVSPTTGAFSSSAKLAHSQEPSSSRDTSEEPPLARYLAEEEEDETDHSRVASSHTEESNEPSVVVNAPTPQKNRNYKDLTLTPQVSSSTSAHQQSQFSKPLGQSLPSPTSNWPLPSFGTAGLGSGTPTAGEISPALSSQMATPVVTRSGTDTNDNLDDPELTPSWDNFKPNRQQSTIPSKQAFTASVYALEIGAGPYAAERTAGSVAGDDLVPPSFPNFNHGGSGGGGSNSSHRIEPRTVPQYASSEILVGDEPGNEIGAAVTTDPSPPVFAHPSPLATRDRQAHQTKAQAQPLAVDPSLDSIGVARGLSIYDKKAGVESSKRNHRGGGIYTPDAVIEEEFQDAQEQLSPYQKAVDNDNSTASDTIGTSLNDLERYQSNEHIVRSYGSDEKSLALQDVTELGAPVIREVADVDPGHTRFGRHTPTGKVDKFGTGFI